MAQKPSIPKGTRDFSPTEMVRRNYIFDTIKAVFQSYGYMPIETPAMENLETLMGKYGEEGDKLLFKVLNSGDFLSKVNHPVVAGNDSSRLANQICDKGLRYDLTVPFARFVVQHQGEIAFPFKRYQIQPVWRADRPQKGRYREFYQCDVDVVGSNSLLNEVELVQIVDEVFQKLGIRVVIKLNNRKILAGIAEIIGEPNRLVDITVAIDKIEKVGIEQVNSELASKGLAPEAIQKLQPLLTLEGSNEIKLLALKDLLSGSEIGLKGVEELMLVIELVNKLNLRAAIEMDMTLARGLNYYTGAIIEVKAMDVEIGSITGGGRYDDLTGLFGLKGVSGVGISFGADRIFDVMNHLNIYPGNVSATTRLMFVNFGQEEASHCLELATFFRQNGVSTELFPDADKIKKQLAYAGKKEIEYVALVGDNEIANNKITLKKLATGEQFFITLEEAVTLIIKD